MTKFFVDHLYMSSPKTLYLFSHSKFIAGNIGQSHGWRVNIAMRLFFRKQENET